MIYHVFVDFGLFSFMNCINNFSICVKIYCQIHIPAFICIIYYISICCIYIYNGFLSQSVTSLNKGCGIPPSFGQFLKIYFYLFYIQVVQSGHRYRQIGNTTILHQDSDQRVNNSNYGDSSGQLGLGRTLSINKNILSELKTPATCVSLDRRVFMLGSGELQKRKVKSYSFKIFNQITHYCLINKLIKITLQIPTAIRQQILNISRKALFYVRRTKGSRENSRSDH